MIWNHREQSPAVEGLPTALKMPESENLVTSRRSLELHKILRFPFEKLAWDAPQGMEGFQGSLDLGAREAFSLGPEKSK
jgi:hypothetical protein